VGIGDAWELAKAIGAPRLPSLGSPLDTVERRARVNDAFQNLVVGTIAERVFRDRHLSELEDHGFAVLDLHESGENRDYALQRDGLELPVNVKVASSLYRKAKEHVTLDPEDCIPVGSYKALGAARTHPSLVYVFLVDFTMRQRVDAFMDRVEGSLAILWELLSWYGGKRAKVAQDQYVDALFSRHGPELLALAPPVTSFRVVSAQRVLAILREDPRRVPGLGIKKAGQGVFNAELNVHVSVARETVPWTEVAMVLRREGIRPLLDRIRRRHRREVPAPSL
jgi:hypothetical protein